MKVSLFTLSESLSEMLIDELFVIGVTVYQSKDLQQIYKTIIEKEINCLFLDIDVKNVDWKKFIKALKSNEKTMGLYILLFTNYPVGEHINELIMEGVSGVFDKKQPLSTYVDKVKGILTLLEEESQQNQRRYVRVNPDEDEVIQVNMEIPFKGAMKGTIRDLSVVAAAILLTNPDQSSYFTEQMKINNLQIKLGKKIIFCEASVIRVAGNMIVVNFVNRKPIFNKGLVKYIFDKINFGSEE